MSKQERPPLGAVTVCGWYAAAIAVVLTCLSIAGDELDPARLLIRALAVSAAAVTVTSIGLGLYRQRG